MIFNWIELQNFRQYRDVRLKFPSAENDITLLIAQNGVGKTTLLQAFRFCFYGESPNYLKLADVFSLLNFSARAEMSDGEICPVSVSIHFSFDGDDFIARRTITYVCYNGVVKSKGHSAFALLRNDGTGFAQVEKPEEMMNQIMPAGLAHVYMFDGERMEKRVETAEYQSDFREAITGVLGLKEKAKALSLLGSTKERGSVIYRINSMMIPSSTEESILKRDADSWQNTVTKNEAAISSTEESIKIADEKIKVAQELLKRRQEFKTIVETKEKLESQLHSKQLTLENKIRDGLGLQSKAVLYVELLKHKEAYVEFTKRKGKKQEIFTGLHKDVITAILKKGYCICGRPVAEHSEEMAKLLSLATLPNDNTLYMQGITSLFNRASQLPQIMHRIQDIRRDVSVLNSEIGSLNVKFEKAVDDVIKAQKESKSDESGELSLGSLRDYRHDAERKIKELTRENNGLMDRINSVDGQLHKMRVTDAKNKKIQFAVDQLVLVAGRLSSELTLKQVNIRASMEKHLNEAISALMETGMSAELSKNYELTISKDIKSKGVDETGVLSTGQSVMISLSFLSALLKTVSEELPDKKSAVVMDAALSNVDERHIRLASERILSNFDQLIFMSFKRQLRNELFDGIKSKVRKAYELSKDVNNNVVYREIDLSALPEYIEKRDNDEL